MNIVGEQGCRNARAVWVALILAIGVGVSLLVGAAPAHAGGSSAPDLKACFGPYYQNGAMQLYRWNGASWVLYRQGKTNSTSCGTWNDVAPNSYYYARAYQRYNVGFQVWEVNGTTAAGLVGTVYDGQYALPKGTAYGPYRIY